MGDDDQASPLLRHRRALVDKIDEVTKSGDEAALNDLLFELGAIDVALVREAEA